MRKTLIGIIVVVLCFVAFTYGMASKPNTTETHIQYGVEKPDPIVRPEDHGTHPVIQYPSNNSTATETVTPSETTAPEKQDKQEEQLPPRDALPVPEGSSLEVTFIDVGQGDAILISCDGHYMLIDGGDNKCSSLMYSFLKERGVSFIDVLIATHEDADHVGGIAGALNYATVGAAYCSVTSRDTSSFENMLKYLDKQGVELQIPTAGDVFEIGAARATVIGPTRQHEEINDKSIVVRLDYGSTSFLFTGDMEGPEENAILDDGADVRVNVLKVGHHGSSSSTGYRLLYAAQPTYGVISCGTGNSYGHPHDTTMSKLRDAEVTVYRTDLQGDVICRSDGTTLTWETEKDASEFALNPTETDGTGQRSVDMTGKYIGNLKSNVFHQPSCDALPNENNRILFDSREEAINAGYRACGKCHP